MYVGRGPGAGLVCCTYGMYVQYVCMYVGSRRSLLALSRRAHKIPMFAIFFYCTYRIVPALLLPVFNLFSNAGCRMPFRPPATSRALMREPERATHGTA